MAKGSLNKVMLIGNLGKDPEIRYTPNGLAVANVTIATTEVWKDKQSGDNQERTEWHRVVMYSRLAEITGEYLKKGAKIFIEGRLQTRKWQDKGGQDRYTTEIVADSLEMLGGKTSSGGHDASSSSSSFSPAAKTSSEAPQAELTESFDDDIPF